MNKFERQGAILRLVQERPLATQAEVAEALREAGIEPHRTFILFQCPLQHRFRMPLAEQKVSA